MWSSHSRDKEELVLLLSFLSSLIEMRERETLSLSSSCEGTWLDNNYAHAAYGSNISTKWWLNVNKMSTNLNPVRLHKINIILRSKDRGDGHLQPLCCNLSSAKILQFLITEPHRFRSSSHSTSFTVPEKNKAQLSSLAAGIPLLSNLPSLVEQEEVPSSSMLRDN